MVVVYQRKGYAFLMEYDKIKVEEMTMDNITKINVPDIPDNEILRFWEASEEEQEEIDQILAELDIR